MKGNPTLFALPNTFTPFAPALAHSTPFCYFVFFSVEGMCCVNPFFIIFQLSVDFSTALLHTHWSRHNFFSNKGSIYSKK
jgi:hypothetical protein